MNMREAIEYTDRHGLADRCRAIAATLPPWTDAQRSLLASMIEQAQRRALDDARADIGDAA